MSEKYRHERFIHCVTMALVFASRGGRATARDFAALARHHMQYLTGVSHERAVTLLEGLDGALDITGYRCGSNLAPVKIKVGES